MAAPRRCTSVSASSSESAPSACSAENSPTLWPAATRSAPATPSARSSANCAAASATSAGWVNSVRNSTPFGCRTTRPSARRSSRGLRSTMSSSENPSAVLVCASARSHERRAASERCRPSAPRPWRWMPWPGNTKAVGSGSTTASPSATSVSPARTRTWSTRRPPTTAIRVASKSRIAPSATGARKLTRHSRSRSGSPPHSASTTNAEARAAVQAPCAIGRGSPAIRAASTERCSGLRSPPTRANASIDAGAASSAVASVRAGRGSRSGRAGASRARAAATGWAAGAAAGGEPAAGRGEAERAGDVAPSGGAAWAREAARDVAPSGGVAWAGEAARAGDAGDGETAVRAGDEPPRIVAIGTPARSTVPVADQRGPPSCGTSTVVTARTCRRSPAARSASSASQGCAVRKSASPASASVSVRSWTSRRRSAKAVAGASPRIASSASTSASTPRSQVKRARQCRRVGAPTGSSSSTRRASVCPASPARGGHAGPGVTACEAWTSSDIRAASSG